MLLIIIPKAITLVISLIVCFFIWGCSVIERDINTVKISAQLLRVISGQTIEVVILERDNQPQKVRIIGIDVPKSTVLRLPRSENNLWQQQAQTKLQELITSNDISLELEDNQPDRYNRILAHVWQNDILVSEQLAKEGYAIANTKYPHQYSDRLWHAQEYARILGYGIWEQP